jgi:hypothetical protein
MFTGITVILLVLSWQQAARYFPVKADFTGLTVK